MGWGDRNPDNPPGKRSVLQVGEERRLTRVTKYDSVRGGLPSGIVNLKHGQIDYKTENTHPLTVLLICIPSLKNIKLDFTVCHELGRQN